MTPTSYHSTQPDSRLATGRIALFVILASETVLFGTLVVSYLFLRSSQTIVPFAQHDLAHLFLPAANTLVLLGSALVARNAITAVRQDNIEALKSSLLITFGLGLIFVLGQVTEFRQSGMLPSDPAFGGIFFALISFHALHVLAGMLVLAVDWIKARLGDFNASRYSGVEVGAWFWYYVAAVWLTLFVILYLV